MTQDNAKPPVLSLESLDPKIYAAGQEHLAASRDYVSFADGCKQNENPTSYGMDILIAGSIMRGFVKLLEGFAASNPALAEPENLKALLLQAAQNHAQSWADVSRAKAKANGVSPRDPEVLSYALIDAKRTLQQTR